MSQMLSPDMTIAAEAAVKAKIEVKNLNFYYGSNRALKNLTIPIADRQVTGPIGPQCEWPVEAQRAPPVPSQQASHAEMHTHHANGQSARGE